MLFDVGCTKSLSFTCSAQSEGSARLTKSISIKRGKDEIKGPRAACSFFDDSHALLLKDNDVSKIQ